VPEERTYSVSSEQTIEVRSEYDEEPENRFKSPKYRDDETIDGDEEDPDINAQVQMQLSWRREHDRPQMEP